MSKLGAKEDFGAFTKMLAKGCTVRNKQQNSHLKLDCVKSIFKFTNGSCIWRKWSTKQVGQGHTSRDPAADNVP